jgi:hypothetical protein
MAHADTLLTAAQWANDHGECVVWWHDADSEAEHGDIELDVLAMLEVAGRAIDELLHRANPCDALLIDTALVSVAAARLTARWRTPDAKVDAPHPAREQPRSREARRTVRWLRELTASDGVAMRDGRSVLILISQAEINRREGRRSNSGVVYRRTRLARSLGLLLSPPGARRLVVDRVVLRRAAL